LLLAVILALGFAVVWATLVVWVSEMARDYFGPPRCYENVVLRMDGTPVIRKGIGRYNENESYFTLEGKPLSISRQEAWLSGAFLAGTKGDPSYGLPWQKVNHWDEELAGFNDNGQPMTYWYWLRHAEPPRPAYFVGFDSVSKRCIGYLGRRGFQAEQPSAAECFPVPKAKGARIVTISNQFQQWSNEPWYPPYSEGGDRFPGWLVYVLTDDGIIEVDLLKRSTRLFSNEPGVLSAHYVSRGFPTPLTTDSPKYRSEVKQFMAVRTKDHVLVLDSQGKLASRFAIPAEYREVGFSFHFLSDKAAVLQIFPLALRQVLSEHTNASRLLWIDTAGTIVRQRDFSARGWYFYGEQFLSPWHTSYTAPAPLAMAAASMGLQPWLYVSWSEEPTFANGLQRSLAEFWPALLMICLFGGLMAWLCYRRQTRYGLPWTKTWVMFVFLGGFPGLVAYHVHRRWPALKPCPNCGRPLPCDRDSCFSCGRELPAPAPKGIEVFA